MYPVDGDHPQPERSEFLPTDHEAAALAREWRAELRRAGSDTLTHDGLDRVIQGEPCPTRLGRPLRNREDLREFWRARERAHQEERDAIQLARDRSQFAEWRADRLCNAAELQVKSIDRLGYVMR